MKVAKPIRNPFLRIDFASRIRDHRFVDTDDRSASQKFVWFRECLGQFQRIVRTISVSIRADGQLSRVCNKIGAHFDRRRGIATEESIDPQRGQYPARVVREALAYTLRIGLDFQATFTRNTSRDTIDRINSIGQLLWRGIR